MPTPVSTKILPYVAVSLVTYLIISAGAFLINCVLTRSILFLRSVYSRRA